MLLRLLCLCTMLSLGSSQTLWLPRPFPFDVTLSRDGVNPENGATTYHDVDYTTEATTTYEQSPALILVEASNFAIVRVPGVREPELPQGFFVEYSCTLGSEGQAQCVRTVVGLTTTEFATGFSTGFVTDIASWVTSACAATTMPPMFPTPTDSGAPLPEKLAALPDPTLLPCPLDRPKPSNSPLWVDVLKFFGFLGIMALSVGILGFGIRLIAIAVLQWNKPDLVGWDAPSILHSLIYVPQPEGCIDSGSPNAGPSHTSTTDADGEREGEGERCKDRDSTVLDLGAGTETLAAGASAGVPNLSANGGGGADGFGAENLPDLLEPRTTSASAFCSQVLSSPAAKNITVESIETRFSHKRAHHFLLLRVKWESRLAYLRVDMLGGLDSPSSLPHPLFALFRGKANGATLRVFDQRAPDMKQLLVDTGMSTATFYATRWLAQYPNMDATDPSVMHILELINAAHHYQLLQIGRENLASSTPPTLHDFARILYLLEEEVSTLALHPILRYPVPVDVALLWTTLLRTVLLTVYRPQWLISHQRLSVNTSPHTPLLLLLVIFVAFTPLIALMIVLPFIALLRWDHSFTETCMLVIIPFASVLVLKVLAIDIVFGHQRRKWDVRMAAALSRIYERMEGCWVEERTLVQDEAINLHSANTTQSAPAMSLFHLVEPDPEPRSSKYNLSSGLSLGLSQSAKIILEPLPTTEFIPDDVLEPRQTTLGQFCADLRANMVGSNALVEAISWRKSRKQPFLHEFVLLLVRHGVRYFTVRVDRRGKLNKALDGLLISGNAMEIVTIEPWRPRSYRTADLFLEHGESDTVVTLVSWRFELPWMTDLSDGNLITLAQQQRASVVKDLRELGNSVQLSTAHRPELGDLVLLWETMGREAPRYCLPSYNCYWQSRTMTCLIARCFPREFLIRGGNLQVDSIRELRSQSFVVDDFLEHWRPVYGVVGYSVVVALGMGMALTFLLVVLFPALVSWGDSYDRIITPEISHHEHALEASKDLDRQWAVVKKLAIVTVASVFIIMGSIESMGWNMDRATGRMWNCLQPSDEVIAMELAATTGRLDKLPTSTPARSVLPPSPSTSAIASGSSPPIAHDPEDGSLDRSEGVSPKARGKRKAES